MAVRALINKEVIPYICAGKKVTIEYLHNSTHFQTEKLAKWLDITDSTLPTILQAKKIAKCLHIPFAGLYMNTGDINIRAVPAIKNYRTLDGSLSIDDSGFNIAICDVLQERDFLVEESEELGIEIPTFSAPSISSEDPALWAKTIREYYAINLADQYKCASSRQFYLYLRDKLESKGVFVQCFTDVPVEVVRGFSIYDEQMPIIGINNDDRAPAKSFSLIHELTHLLKRESSVCNIMFNATSSLAEEVFCNAVAGELLVPKDALRIVLSNGGYKRPYTTDAIRLIASRFSVSREVIIRRLLDTNRINSIEYDTYADEFRREVERDREEQRLARQAGLTTGFRPSVSREAIDRTSSVVCKALYYGYGEEMYSKRDIAQHLGIAQKHVDKFLAEVSAWSR